MIELETSRAVLALSLSLSLAIVGLSAASARAEGSQTEPLAPMTTPPAATAPAAGVVTLKRCLELAERNYPRIQEAIAKSRARRHDVDAAHYAPYTEFFATGQIGPAPTVRGTNQFSPNTDAALTSHMGIAWSVGVEGMIPLWTFGKITNVWDAAEANARVGELAVDKERNELRLAVRRAYFGAQAAQDGIVIVTESIRGIDRYLPGLEAKVKSGDADEIDLLKLQMQRAEYEARESEGLKVRANAIAGLRFLTGLTGAIAVSNEPLTRSRHELGPLARYLQAARLNRPEVNMVRAGILAQEARVRLERARYFPDLGIGITAQWARATERTDQRNPYTADSSNKLGYGAAFVMNYKLDFMPQIARVAGAEAELEAMRASERYALGGVGIEVEEAFREAEDAKRRLDAWSRATDLAERWLSQVEKRIEVGTLSEKDLFDPTEEVAEKRFGKLQAIFAYNVALARLALATGWEQGIVDY